MADRACGECDRLRETVTRLNRRCQEAESALREKPDIDRAKFVRGNLGRALLAWHNSRLQPVADAARAWVAAQEAWRGNCSATFDLGDPIDEAEERLRAAVAALGGVGDG